MRAVFCGVCGQPTGGAAAEDVMPEYPRCRGCTDVPRSRSLSVHEDASYTCHHCGDHDFEATEQFYRTYHANTFGDSSGMLQFSYDADVESDGEMSGVECTSCGAEVPSNCWEFM